MSRKRREVKEFKYECTLTGESFTLTAKAENPDELMSVNAWYELNPEKDDRPQDIIKKLGMIEKIEADKKLEEESEESGE